MEIVYVSTHIVMAVCLIAIVYMSITIASGEAKAGRFRTSNDQSHHSTPHLNKNLNHVNEKLQ